MAEYKPNSKTELSAVLNGNEKTGRHFWITIDGVNIFLDAVKVRASLGIEEKQYNVEQLNMIREYRARLKELLGKEVPVVIEENEEGVKKVTAIKVAKVENDEFPGEVTGILEKSPAGGYLIRDSKNRIFFLTEQALSDFEVLDRPIERCLGFRIEGREEKGFVVEIYNEDSEVPVKQEFQSSVASLFPTVPQGEKSIPKNIRDLPETFESLEQAFKALESIGINSTDLDSTPRVFGRIFKKEGSALPVFKIDDSGRVSFTPFGKSILAGQKGY